MPENSETLEISIKLKDLAIGAITSAMSALSALGGTSESAVSRLTSLRDSILALIPAAVPPQIQAVNTEITTLSEVSATAAENLTPISDGLTAVSEQSGTAGEAVGAVGESLSGLADASAAVGEAGIADTLGGVAEQADAVSGASEALAEAFSGISESASGAAEQSGAVVDGLSTLGEIEPAVIDTTVATQESLEQVGTTAESIVAEIQALADAMSGLGEGVPQNLPQATDEIQELIDAVTNDDIVVTDISGWFKDFEEGAGKAEESANNTSKAVLGLAGSIAGMVAAYVSVEAISGAVTAFQEFQVAVDGVQQVSSLSFAEIKTSMSGIPPILGNMTELAGGYTMVLSAGVTDAKDAMDLLTIASQTAKAAHVDQAVMVDGLTAVLAAYAGQVKTAEEANELLFAIQAAGKGTVEGLISEIGELSGVSNLGGIAAKEMAAAVSQLTLTSGSTSIAATAYKSLVLELTKGTPLLDGLAASTGKYATSSQMLKEIGLEETLKQTMAAAEKTGVSFSNMFSSVDALKGAVSLSSDSFKGFDAAVKAVDNSLQNQSGKKSFENWSKTIEAQMGTLGNTFSNFAINIGEKFAPAVSNGLEKFSAWFNTNQPTFMLFFDAVGTAASKFVENLSFNTDSFTSAISSIASFKDTFISAFEIISKAVGFAGSAVIEFADMLIAGGLLYGALAVIPAMFTAISTATTAYTMSLATAEGKTALFANATTAAKAGIGLLGAAMAGWNIGKLIGDFELFGLSVNGIMQSAYDSTDSFEQKLLLLLNPIALALKAYDSLFGDVTLKNASMVDSVNPLLEKLGQFKDFKLPDDFANASILQTQQLNSELKKSELYWTAYKQQQDVIIEQAKLSGQTQTQAYNAAIKGAQEASVSLAYLSNMHEKLNTAVSSNQTALDNSKKAYENYISTVKALESKMTAELKTELDTRLKDVDADTAKKTISFSDAEDKKRQIAQEINDKIAAIRAQSVQSLAEGSKQEIAIAESTAAIKIQKIQEEIEAGLKTKQTGAAEELEITKALETQKADIVKAAGTLLSNEADAIRKKDFDLKTLAFEKETAAQDTEYKKQTAAFESALQTQVKSKAASEQEKKDIEETFLSGSIQSATGYLTELMAVYEKEIEDKKTAITKKEALDTAYIQNQIARLKKQNEELYAIYIADIENKQLAGQKLDDGEQAKLDQFKRNNEAIKAFEDTLLQARSANATALQTLQVSAEDARAAAVQEASAKILETINAETAGRDAETQKRIAEVGLAEAQGVISAQDAANQKRQIELDFTAFKLSQASEAVAAAASVAGSDSEQYKAAVQAKIAVETELINKKAEVAAAASAAAESEKSAVEGTTEAIKEQGAAAETAGDNIISSYTIVEQSFSTLQKELRNSLENPFGIKFVGLDGLPQAFSDVSTALMDVTTQFDALGKMATDAGLKVDMSKQTLSEASSDVQSRIGGWNEFKDALSEVGKEFGTWPALAGIVSEVSDRFGNLQTSVADIDFSTLASQASDLTEKVRVMNQEFATGDVEKAKQMSESIQAEFAAYQEAYDKKIALFAQETDAKGAELARSLAEIELSVATGVLKESEGITQKKALEEGYAQFKIDQANKLVAETAAISGTESEEYKTAIQEKQAAELEFMQFKIDAATNTKDTLLAVLEAETNERAVQFERQMSELKLAELQGVEDSKVISEQRNKIETDFAAFKLEQAKQAESQLLSVYGAESESYKAAVQERIDAEIGYAEKQKDTVSAVKDGYEKIYDTGKEKLDKLKTEWDEYYGKIEGITSQILDLNQSTEETIRDLKRDTMTEAEVWNDKRLEYDQLYSEATKQLQQGNADAATELFKQAINVAKELATEVKTESGEVLASNAENTTLSIELIEKARAEAEKALASYRDGLTKSQQQVTDEISKTENGLKTLSDQINETESKFKVSFTGEGSAELPLMQKITDMTALIANFAKDTESYQPKIKLDLNDLSSGVDEAKGKLQELYNTIQEKVKMQVDFMGRGSDEKPLSEKITEMFGKVGKFASEVERISPEMSLDMTEISKQVIEYKDSLTSKLGDLNTVFDDLKKSAAAIADDIAATVGRIDSINMSTADILHNIDRQGMSDAEKWADDKKQAEQAMADAKKAQSEGDAKLAEEYFMKARDLSAKLATEIKDTDGNIIQSLAESSEIAKALVAQAGSGAVGAAEIQKASLEKKGEEINKELDTTGKQITDVETQLTTISEKLTAITGAGLKIDASQPLLDFNAVLTKIEDLRKKVSLFPDLNINMTGTGSPTKPLSEKLSDMASAVGAFATAMPTPEMMLNMSGISDQLKNFDGNISANLDAGLAAVSAPVAMGGAVPSGIEGMGLKDYGKTEIVIGGAGYPVIGQQDVISAIQKELRRNTLTG